MGALFTPLVKDGDLLFQLVVQSKVFPQSFKKIGIGELQLFQPIQMLLCPVAFSVKMKTQPGSKGDDLLLG